MLLSLLPIPPEMLPNQSRGSLQTTPRSRKLHTSATSQFLTGHCKALRYHKVFYPTFQRYPSKRIFFKASSSFPPLPPYHTYIPLINRSM